MEGSGEALSSWLTALNCTLVGISAGAAVVMAPLHQTHILSEDTGESRDSNASSDIQVCCRQRMGMGVQTARKKMNSCVEVVPHVPDAYEHVGWKDAGQVNR